MLLVEILIKAYCRILLIINWVGRRIKEIWALKEITYVSTADNKRQPAMLYVPRARGKIPLIVALHTWGGGYKQEHHRAFARYCIENGWAYIHPHFRGPNNRPEAAGSELVVKDIVGAVEYVKTIAAIDTSSIFLVGTSGGGFAALLMAGLHPEIWAGVSVWSAISDLRAWYEQGWYRDDLKKCCGGEPGSSNDVDAEYLKRSPLTYLAAARTVKLHVNAGINDGHDGSVPISHSLFAFNEVAEIADRLSDAEIRYFWEKAEVPPHLSKCENDPDYGTKWPLFRRSSGNAILTIFEGGHEIVPAAALSWFESIYRDYLNEDNTKERHPKFKRRLPRS